MRLRKGKRGSVLSKHQALLIIYTPLRYAPAAVETQDKVVEEYKNKLEQEAGPQKGKKKKN